MYSRSLIFFIPILGVAAIVPAGTSGVRPGPIMSLSLRWKALTEFSLAGRGIPRMWTAEFSLNSEKPLITRMGTGTKRSHLAPTAILGHDWKRRGRAGFDEFFDFPGSHPEGTRRFEGAFRPITATVRSVGNRMEVLFQGLKLGIFEGGIAYTFYPGMRLIYQEAVVSTQEPNTAYLYDTGLRLAAPASGVRPGRREVVSPVTYYDTEGKLRIEMTTGRIGGRRPCPLPVRSRHSWTEVAWRYFRHRIPTLLLATTPPTPGYVWFHGCGPVELDVGSWGSVFDTPPTTAPDSITLGSTPRLPPSSDWGCFW